MNPGMMLATLLLAGCAAAQGGRPAEPTPVWVRSHNGSPVDVYLLCGSSDARWLGTVTEKSSDAFEISAGQGLCAAGLNFFLVVQQQRRGYWVGPFRTHYSDPVELVIEKYAGLSSARVRFDAR